MQSEVTDIHRRVLNMRQSPAAMARDQQQDLVRLVRQGKIEQLMPDMFADDMPKSVVANLIDTAARDTAELLAPLPALACASGNMTSHTDELRASKKNKIGSHYWSKSKLSSQMFKFADSYNSYAFATWIVEANFECKSPVIRFESPWGAYYHRDRWGSVSSYVKITRVEVAKLCAEYPEHTANIVMKNGRRRGGADTVELVRYMDRHCTVIYLPDCHMTVLARVKNPVSRLPVVIAERPDLEDKPRGQYDDVIWVQLARAIMAQYQLKGAEKAVNAPLVVDDSVTDLPMGPDAVIRSQNPAGIRLLNLDLPRDAYALGDQLDKESKTGARYPDSRTGGMQGNIITGRGVQALMGTMDTQIQTGQTIFAAALEEATSLCFELDVALWPNEQKKITGVLTGKPFELTYTPAKDIGDSFGCKTTYGFAAGLTPAQAIVMLLQLRGDKLVGRDTVRRQLPFDIDPEEEQRAVDVEDMEGSLTEGFKALLQSIGPMAMQGQDVLPIVLNAAKALDLRQKGTPIHKAILEAMTPEEQPEPAVPEQPGIPGAPGELPPGVGPDGLQPGVAYGQAGMAPGGMPAISSLMAELRGNGQANMGATILRKRAVGSG